MPKTSKGQKFKFETSCVTWVDLLGYGSMLETVHFDPTSETAQKAIDRIELFHKCITEASRHLFPTFIMNDGAVAYRDLSPREKGVTFEFLRQSFELFKRINQIDQIENHYPGARMIIASGFRVRRVINIIPRLTLGEAKAIKDRIKRNRISIEQAINQALMARFHSDSTPELQHNFALTKAYLANESGSRAGLGGPNCYVDLALFEKELPNWINISRIIEWTIRGINASFGLITDINLREANKNKMEGILDSFEIARNISNSDEAIIKIKESRLGNLRNLSGRK